MPIDLTFRRGAVSCLAAIALCASATGALHAAGGLERGLRFDSPGVLDLSERTQKIAGNAIPVETLAPADAEAILAAPAIGEEEPPLQFSDDVYGCAATAKACPPEHERKLIAASGGAVKRDGKRLIITPAAGAALTFVDWKMPETKTADGDEETHLYLGRLDNSGYHRVEVQFGQDAPGDFLINSQNGKVAFVHNGSDVAVLAPGGLHVVTFNTLNPPLSIRVALLDASGPRLDLQCDADKGGERVTAQFKGWHDARSFDLAIVVKNARSKLEHQFAVRVTQGSAGWAIATPDQAQLEPIGFACRASAPLKP